MDNGPYAAAIAAPVIGSLVAFGIGGMVFFCYKERSGPFAWHRKNKGKGKAVDVESFGSESIQMESVGSAEVPVTFPGRCADPEK